jgi:allophanate hydrolase subunit 1
MNILKRKIANKLNTRLPSSDKPDSLDSYSQQPEVKKHVKHSNSLEIHTLYEDVEPDIEYVTRFCGMMIEES